MSLLKTLFPRGSVAAPTTLHSEATVRSLPGPSNSVITVGVRLVEDRKQRLGARLEEPFVAELTEELVQFYKRKRFSVARRNLIRAFDGYAIDGVAKAQRSVEQGTRARLRAFSVVFTKFEGLGLRVGWGQGVILATASACLSALGEPRKTTKLGADGWEET